MRGSVTNVLKGDSTTSSSPTLIRSYVYDAYGETDYTTFTGGETFNANSYLAYTGAILDQQTGLYYLMSRYYDPKAGSFISQDSYRGEGEAFWHLYAYCDGDPVNFVDRVGNKQVAIQYDNKLDKDEYKYYGELITYNLILNEIKSELRKNKVLNYRLYSLKYDAGYYGKKYISSFIGYRYGNRYYKRTNNVYNKKTKTQNITYTANYYLSSKDKQFAKVYNKYHRPSLVMSIAKELGIYTITYGWGPLYSVLSIIGSTTVDVLGSKVSSNIKAYGRYNVYVARFGLNRGAITQELVVTYFRSPGGMKASQKNGSVMSFVYM